MKTPRITHAYLRLTKERIVNHIKLIFSLSEEKLDDMAKNVKGFRVSGNLDEKRQQFLIRLMNDDLPNALINQSYPAA